MDSRKYKKDNTRYKAHAEAVARKWRDDQEKAGNKVVVHAAVSSNRVCGDYCAAQLRWFARDASGRQPNISAHDWGVESGHVLTGEMIEQRKVAAGRKPWSGRSQSGFRMVIGWYRTVAPLLGIQPGFRGPVRELR